MEISRVTRETTHKVVGFVEGVEELFQATYGAGSKYRPTLFSFEWAFDRTTGGWQIVGARVTGVLIKKDGTEGNRDASRRFVSSVFGPEWDPQTPQWLRDLEAEYRPAGVVLQP